MSHVVRNSWAISGGLVVLIAGALACSAEAPEQNDSAYNDGVVPVAGASAGAAGIGSGGSSAPMIVPMPDAGGSMTGAPQPDAGSMIEADSGVGAMAGTTAGVGGAAGDTATAGAAGEAPEPCVKGRVHGSQVVFIGDSFLAAPTSAIAYELETLMQTSGSTAYSATPRFRQLVGTTMQQVVGQYDTEHMLNPDIKVVIANGGGNDVLVTNRSCLTQAPPENVSCTTTIENALNFASQLMQKAQADGVEHLVYFFYPHEPTQGLFQGTAPTINESLDYTEPMARALCEASPICTFVSLSEAAGDSPGSGYVERGYINPNDVHPSPAGSKFFAEAIWDAMVERCIAQ